MTKEEFLVLSSLNSVPENLSLEQLCVWYILKDDWDKAHNIAQDLDSKIGSLLHGFLHRQEGDIFNARYWYNRAGENFPSISTEEERYLLIDKVI